MLVPINTTRNVLISDNYYIEQPNGGFSLHRLRCLPKINLFPFCIQFLHVFLMHSLGNECY